MDSSPLPFYLSEYLTNTPPLRSTFPLISQMICPAAFQQRLISLLHAVCTVRALVELIKVSHAHHSEAGTVCCVVYQPVIHNTSGLPLALILWRWRDTHWVDDRNEDTAKNLGSASGGEMCSTLDWENEREREKRVGRGQTTQNNEGRYKYVEGEEFIRNKNKPKCRKWGFAAKAFTIKILLN